MATKTTHGSCGKSWMQAGNMSGHCSACHETYYGVSAFDAHQRLVDDEIVCERPAANSKGKPIEWWADEDGQWHLGRRLTAEEKQRIWGRS